ncbi:hypothetical protein BC830DRAFT_1097254 [Chytriomyces sp. MP71]|nr:hypothetical protein BC830DRAFT_1097254 [Chytriomyces sp. MP71]
MSAAVATVQFSTSSCSRMEPPLTIRSPPQTPRSSPGGRSIHFCVEVPSNVFSAIKLALEHLTRSTLDRITIVTVVQSEAQRQVVLSTTRSLLKMIEHQESSLRDNLLLQVLVAPLGNFGVLACETVRASKADLLIVGLSGNTFLNNSSSYCVVNAKCQVVIKRLTSPEPQEEEN